MKNLSLIGLSILLILLALANPIGLWMPHALMNVAVVMLAVAVLFFALAAHEKAEDADAAEKAPARSGYFAGMAILVIGIAYTSLANDPIDLWLILALGGMVLARLFASSGAPAPAGQIRRSIRITGWLALLSLIVVIGGIAYFNLRPRAEVLQGHGKDVMLQGAAIVDQGTQMVKDGAAIVGAGQTLAGTSTSSR